MCLELAPPALNRRRLKNRSSRFPVYSERQVAWDLDSGPSHISHISHLESREESVWHSQARITVTVSRIRASVIARSARDHDRYSWPAPVAGEARGHHQVAVGWRLRRFDVTDAAANITTSRATRRMRGRPSHFVGPCDIPSSGGS